MGPLTKRVLVAFFAIPFLLFLTFWEFSFPFKALMTVAAGLSLLEYLILIKARNLKPLTIEALIALGLVVLPWVIPVPFPIEERATLLGALILLLLSFIWSERPLKEMVVSVSATWFGVAYFGLLVVYFFRLRELPNGAWHLLWLFIATWAYDTGAYLVGTRWGRHRMAPKASPKKSWEGCVGGFVIASGSLFVLWNLKPDCFQCYAPGDVLVIAALLSFFAQMGDLVGSALKRSLGVKDSGSFFPGHGGMLDRIGSLLLNAPVLFYYLSWFKHL